MSKLIRYGGPMSRTRRQGDPIGYSAPLGDSHFWFLQNNGSTVPPWTPSTPEWRVECYFYRQTKNTEAGGFEFIISNSANAAQNGLIVDSAPEAIKFRANHAGGTIILDQADGGSVINTEYYVHGQFKALTNWLEVNGITAATNTTLTPIPVAYDKMGGDTNTTMIGSIWGLFLNDLAAPANSRWYPMNEGSGTQFLCYEADRITRKPAGDITIANATDTHWGVRPVVQKTVLIGAPATGDAGVPTLVEFVVSRKTYAPDPSTYQWSVMNPNLTGTFSDPNAASPTFTPDSEGTYILRCNGKDMGGYALTAATVGFTATAGNPELLVNWDFIDTLDPWTGADWFWEAPGTAATVDQVSNQPLQQEFGHPDAMYKVTWEVLELTSGEIRVGFVGGSAWKQGPIITAPGVYTHELARFDNTTLRVTLQTFPVSCKIGYISCKLSSAAAATLPRIIGEPDE